jgi:hypothetical protein
LEAEGRRGRSGWLAEEDGGREGLK